MKVMFISSVETFPLRQKVLKPNSDIQSCYLPNDNESDTYHLAVIDDNDNVIGVCSLYKAKLPELDTFDQQYNIKAMAIDTDYQNQSTGSHLISFAINFLKEKGVNLIWCNAMQSAVHFYEKLGFQNIGEQFEILDKGFYQTMFLEL